MLSINQCTIVEIPTESEGLSLPTPRDLLPWADPYIARLLSKHRLQAALEDSLDYLSAAVDEAPEPADFHPLEGQGFNHHTRRFGL